MLLCYLRVFGTHLALYMGRNNITHNNKNEQVMKKFTVSAIVAMGAVVLSSAAFAGTTSYNSRGFVSNSSSADTVVPTDTVVPENQTPEQKDTTAKQETPVQFSLVDTVVPADTLTPAKKDEPAKQDTPVKEETPVKQETTPVE